MKILMLSVVFACSFALAAEGVPMIDQITAILKSFSEGSWAMVVAVVLEAALRLFPTDKPRSVLLMIGAVCRQISKLFEMLANMLNKVIPQNLK